MSFFKRLGALFQNSPDTHVLYYYIRCRRCGEVIKARADLRNELSIDYGENELPSGFFYRKVLIGRGRCFQAIEVTMTFDAQRNMTSRKVTGGEFVTIDDYDEAAGG